MRDPRKFGLVLDLAYSSATVLSSLFGVCAYYIWGPETAAVAATNLPAGPATTLVSWLLCAVLVTSYPLQMMPVSNVFDEWLDSAILSAKGWFRKSSEFEPISQDEGRADAPRSSRWAIFEVLELSPQRLLTRIVQVAITFGVAVTFPNLGNFVSLVGCIGFSTGGYLLPALCYYKHFKVKLPRTRIALMFLGAWSVFFVMIPGIITNTNAILHPTGGRS
jgi:amino acid permease